MFDGVTGAAAGVLGLHVEEFRPPPGKETVAIELPRLNYGRQDIRMETERVPAAA
jgi:hypothetical protein